MVTILRLSPYGREADISQCGQIFSYEAMNTALFLQQHFPMQGNISSLTPQSLFENFFIVSESIQITSPSITTVLYNYTTLTVNKTVNITVIFLPFFLFYGIFNENIANFLILC